ncbi:MAG: biotin/lipoyl-binding protein [Anaerolineae bacterium]|jgi:pyruvate carboxylase subunit B
MKYVAEIDGQEFAIEVDPSGEITFCDVPCTACLESAHQDALFTLLIGQTSHEVYLEPRRDGAYTVTIAGNRYEVQVRGERAWRLAAEGTAPRAGTGTATVRSPMPGVVVDILVEPGQVIRAGDGVAILEAMKMENEIRAPRDGVIRSVHVSPGEALSLDDVIIEIGAPEGTTNGVDGEI